MSDDLGFNKIAGAILATALAFIGIKELSHTLYHPHQPSELAYGAEAYAEWEAAQGAGVEKEIELPFPQQDWIDAMSLAAGERLAARCAACHSFNEGGENKTGPNLWNVVGGPSAHLDSFGGYSTAMKEANITWTYENLDAYLERPARFIKGTGMGFAGFKKPEQRAAMIEYMRVQSNNPLPRPEAAAIPMPEVAVPEMAVPAEDMEITEGSPQMPAQEPVTEEN